MTTAETVIFGTNEPVLLSRRLVAGLLSVEIDDGAARTLRWNGVEVVRALDCLVRNESWATHRTTILDEQLAVGARSFECIQRRIIDDGSLSLRLAFSGSSDGLFRASAELTAHREFLTNRAGFVVLHPLAGIAGSSLAVRHEDGSITPVQIPIRISPRQLALEIAGLVYIIQGIETRIDFEGDVFEMEDQRNWSDGSFKTYCRPLSRPVPYVIPLGETVRQEVEIRLLGMPTPRTDARRKVAEPELQLTATDERVPEVAVSLDALSTPQLRSTQIHRFLAPKLLQLRIDSNTTKAVLACAADLLSAFNSQVELEIVLPRQSHSEYLAHVVQECKHHSIRAARVLALPEAYLKSYQPDGPWPEGLTPKGACVAAHEWFPDAQIGAGVLTHFAELNRYRPDLGLCNYISHGSSAIVHTADDRSVIESLEGLSYIYASGRALAGDRDYRLGLVSIGMRSNPYGFDVAPNPEQIRVPMARVDPRQRGLFAAAWAIGVLANTEKHCVSSLALASLTGPFGTIYQRATWPQPLFDERPDATVYPLFHVIRALQYMGGSTRLSVHQLPSGAAAVAAEDSVGVRLVLANLAEDPRHFRLPRLGNLLRLDADTFESATIDASWLQTAQRIRQREITLAPFNVAFVDLLRTAE